MAKITLEDVSVEVLEFEVDVDDMLAKLDDDDLAEYLAARDVDVFTGALDAATEHIEPLLEHIATAHEADWEAAVRAYIETHRETFADMFPAVTAVTAIAEASAKEMAEAMNDPAVIGKAVQGMIAVGDSGLMRIVFDDLRRRFPDTFADAAGRMNVDQRATRDALDTALTALSFAIKEWERMALAFESNSVLVTTLRGMRHDALAAKETITDLRCARKAVEGMRNG